MSKEKKCCGTCDYLGLLLHCQWMFRTALPEWLNPSPRYISFERNDTVGRDCPVWKPKP